MFKRTVQALFLAIAVVLFIGVLYFLYPQWVHDCEWRYEQADFEKKKIAANEVVKRIDQYANGFQFIFDGVDLKINEIQALLQEFLQPVNPFQNTFVFQWRLSQSYWYIAGQSLSLYYQDNIVVRKVSTKFMFLMARLFFAFLATFVTACATATLYRIAFFVTSLAFRRLNKMPPLSKQRNQMAIARDGVVFVICFIYFLMATTLSLLILKNWVRCSFLEAMPIHVRLLSTVLTDSQAIYVNNLATVRATAVCVLAYSSLSLIIFTVVRLVRTVDQSRVHVATIKDIQNALTNDDPLLKKRN